MARSMEDTPQDGDAGPGHTQPAGEDLIQLIDLPCDGTGEDRRRLMERLSGELERRVAERTARLSATNAELRRKIAEHVRTEAALRASEHDIRQVIDGVPVLILGLSRFGRVEQANEPALSYFGRTLREMRNASPRDLLHPQDIGRARQVFAAARRSGEPFETELRIRRADELYRWLRVRAQPRRSAAGRVERWDVVLTDIEERRRGEDALRVREFSARLLVESMDSIPALALVSNRYGEIVLANQQVLDYHKRTLEEVRRWPTSAHIVHPDDLDHANRVVVAALAAGLACTAEYRLLRHDGVYRWFESRYSPVRDATGQVVNWFVLMIDIDERKRSEERLRQSEALLAEGERLSGTGSFRWRLPSGEIIWSEQLYRIFELDPALTVTLDLFRSRVHPDDVAMADDVLGRAARDGADFEGRHRVLLPDGSVKFVEVAARATGDVEGAGGIEYLGIVRDVTERVRAEEALDKVRSDLAHAARVMSLGALTASIAHEINQPLTGIVANAATTLRTLAADPPALEDARAATQRTLRDGNRACEVVGRLRALFSKKPVSADVVDLNDAAGEVLSLSASELTRRKAVVRTRFARDLPPVRGDRVQLQQVILNLVLNAADAMEGVEDRAHDLLVATHSDGAGQIRVCVRDAGVGVARRQAEKLFEAFHTTKAGGMGIGLSVSRSIVEAHGGRLWAEPNEDGPGATFSFALPADGRDLRPDGQTS